MRVKFVFVLKITLKLLSTQPWKQQANHMVSHHFCFLDAKNEGGGVGENDRGIMLNCLFSKPRFWKGNWKRASAVKN